jgi:hypothetical protein
MNFIETDVIENLDKNIFDDIGDTLMFYSSSIEIIPPEPPVPPIISDICFPKHTLIHTDQGEIMISKINTKIHTIHNKKIKAITKTISPDDYLVCFEKHSIDFNYPSKQTIMSKNHKIKYNGKLMKAHTFLEKNKTTIYKIKYTGEVLYNVLMEEYTTIKVNNLLCETLDPNSMIAIIYNNLDKNYIYKLKPYIPPKPSKKMNIKYLK